MKIKLLISLLFLASVSLSGLAQVRGEGVIPDGLEWQQKEKALFVYGFYAAYMNGVMYTPSAEMANRLLKAYTHRRVRREREYMPLLNAQDCTPHNLNTLKVTPLNTEWYEVKFQIATINPSDSMQYLVRKVRLAPKKRTYQIVEVK
ncbi:MAG: hypothetical protein Q4A44_00575 [Bacteroidales bacterium]|nr:hypothetical protein [Bacteroidales bacterium]